MGDDGVLPTHDFARIDSGQRLAAEPNWRLQTGKVVDDADRPSSDRELHNRR